METKSIALSALLLFMLGGAVALWLVHRNDNNDAKLSQLVCDRYGHFDVALCLLWPGVLTMVWVLVYCTLKGKVPDGIAGIYPVFAGVVVGPLLTKVIFKGKPVPPGPTTEITADSVTVKQ